MHCRSIPRIEGKKTLIQVSDFNGLWFFQVYLERGSKLLSIYKYTANALRAKHGTAEIPGKSSHDMNLLACS